MPTPWNNPYIPGDPFSYDLKWIVKQIKEHTTILSTLDDRIVDLISQLLDQHDPLYFNNVDELIHSGLKHGSLAYIMGYYDRGDGGSNLYYITTDYNDVLNAISFITLDGANKWAIPIITTQYVTPQMFGAKMDGATSDREALNTAIKYKNVFLLNGVYAVDFDENNDALIIDDDISLILDENAVIKAIPTSNGHYSILHITGENVKIEGGIIQGERDDHTGSTGEFGHAIHLDGAKNVKISDTVLCDCWGDGIIFGDHKCENVTLTHVTMDNNRRNGCSIINAETVNFTDCYFINSNGTSPQAGLDFEIDNVSTENIKDVFINNCFFSNNTGPGLVLARLGHDCGFIKISNCELYKNPLEFHERNTEIVDGSVVVENVTIKETAFYAIRFSNKQRTGYQIIMNGINCIDTHTSTSTDYQYSTLISLWPGSNVADDCGNIAIRGLFVDTRGNTTKHPALFGYTGNTYYELDVEVDKIKGMAPSFMQISNCKYTVKIDDVEVVTNGSTKNYSAAGNLCSPHTVVTNGGGMTVSTAGGCRGPLTLSNSGATNARITLGNSETFFDSPNYRDIAGGSKMTIMYDETNAHWIIV